VEPEDVVYVLDRMVEAVRPEGVILDLQVIRPNPRVELEDGVLVCEIDGEPLFRLADAATEAVDAAIVDDVLVEEATDDHDVRKHYRHGPDLIADFESKERRLPPDALPRLREIDRVCVVRERCRLRRLRRAST
jgi:hypothetical protein